jgi:hypothetical protein
LKITSDRFGKRNGPFLSFFASQPISHRRYVKQVSEASGSEVLLSSEGGYSQSDLDKVALRLNQRPRKTLGFETPASKLQASVASTG